MSQSRIYEFKNFRKFYTLKLLFVLRFTCDNIYEMERQVPVPEECSCELLVNNVLEDVICFL